jgi:exopolyphosphatase/guanosine-5'-triphosphate,3'-diphosphate pyrophosphatase
MSLLASLDLGTNTFRLLIAEVTDNDTLVPIVIKRAITRLGEGLYKNETIQPHAIKRSLEVVKQFSKIIDQHKAEKVFAVSTSVTREAKNGKEFIAQVYKQTGIPVKILTGFEEAQLTLKGVFSVVDKITQKSLVFDIGGGSTEFILTEDTDPIKITSIPLGVVHLAENLITSDPPVSSELLNLRNNIKESLQMLDFKNLYGSNISPLPASIQCSLIGTAGTVTTLAAIEQQMERYDPLKINNYNLSRETIENIYHYLSCSSLAERRTIPGLEEGRETVIVPGAAIVLEIMDYFSFNQITVSDSGLLEGILLDAQTTI